MTEPTSPYLLFHPKFICKFGNSWREYGQWDFRQVRKQFDKQWWKAGCFAIDADMRRFELIEVVSLGPAWISGNLWASREGTFLTTKHVFKNTFDQLDFEQSREFYVDSVCSKRWWCATNEN